MSLEQFLCAKSVEYVLQYVQAARGPFEDGLGTLVRFRSISQDVACEEKVVQCAETAKNYLFILAESVKAAKKPVLLFPKKGLPTLYWHYIRNPKWPTVIIYNHLDVQPARMEDGWDTEPFKLVARDVPTLERQYFGRGTTDDKGPALAGLLAMKFAIDRGLPVNFVVVWETEEEDGSDHFPEILEQVQTELRALQSPSLLISDSIWPAENIPAVSCGLRGVLSLTFELTTAIDKKGRARGVHSGLCGGVATNPIIRLARVITAAVDAKGRVTFPGSHESLKPLSLEDREAFEKTGAISLEAFQRDYGLRSCLADSVPDLLDRIWNLPTFEVTGITSGTTEPAHAVKTEIPGYARAHIACRLGPGQDAEQFEQALRKYVKELDPEVEIIRRGGVGHPFAMDPKGPYIQAAVEALKQGFGYQQIVHDRCGGSIGAVTHFTKILPSLPVVLLGLSLPSHNYHGAQENFDWRQAAGGIRTFIGYFDRVAEMQNADGK